MSGTLGEHDTPSPQQLQSLQSPVPGRRFTPSASNLFFKRSSLQELGLGQDQQVVVAQAIAPGTHQVPILLHQGLFEELQRLLNRCSLRCGKDVLSFMGFVACFVVCAEQAKGGTIPDSRGYELWSASHEHRSVWPTDPEK